MCTSYCSPGLMWMWQLLNANALLDGNVKRRSNFITSVAHIRKLKYNSGTHRANFTMVVERIAL